MHYHNYENSHSLHKMDIAINVSFTFWLPNSLDIKWSPYLQNNSLVIKWASYLQNSQWSEFFQGKVHGHLWHILGIALYGYRKMSGVIVWHSREVPFSKEVKKLATVMDPVASSPCSQNSALETSSELVVFNPHLHIIYSKMQFNIILSYGPRFLFLWGSIN